MGNSLEDGRAEASKHVITALQARSLSPSGTLGITFNVDLKLWCRPVAMKGSECCWHGVRALETLRPLQRSLSRGLGITEYTTSTCMLSLVNLVVRIEDTTTLRGAPCVPQATIDCNLPQQQQ